MSGTIQAAAALMGLAMVCYTTGVWGERVAGRLRPGHTALFWLGLTADSAGTEMMRRYAGGVTLNVHSVAGAIALVLMFAHAVWATVILWRRQERMLVTFHRISVVVWGIWMVPFITGMVMGMRHR